jgi:hypothetical protein
VSWVASLHYASPDGPLVGPEVEVEIADGRRAGLPGWPECGFERVDHQSTVRDWGDDDEIAAVHYPEMEALARALTGCDAALLSDHVKRTAASSRGPSEQTPVRLVHSDYAANYQDVARHAYDEVHGRGAAALARAGLSAEEIQHARRIVMLQFWRNVGPPRMDLPLAFCDGRTLTPADTRPFPYTGYVAGGRSFDALAVVAPASPDDHAWYAYPDLGSHEVVAFRTYDTDLVREGRTWFTPHSAFRDAAVEPGRPARSSIEVRVMCLVL